MPYAPQKTLTALATFATIAAVLTGCAPAPLESPGTPSETPPAAAAQKLPECEGILLAAGEVVSGENLGACIASAMLAASSGTHRVEATGSPATVVDFRWDPDYSMHSSAPTGSTIIDGDTGWIQMDGRWIQEDPSSQDAEVILATGTIALVRATSDPRTIAEYFALSPTWSVVGEESVPADDAVTDSGWKLVPDTYFSVGPVTMSDMAIWLTPNYLGSYFTATGSAFGFTTVTTNTFLQWGEPVDIPRPQG